MIAIRAATVADAADIAAVHVQSHREAYVGLFGPDYTAPTVAERLAMWRKVLSSGGAYVALDDRRVIGFGHARGTRITTLYILSSHHRRGIGRRLLRALLDHLRAQGVDEARFEVLMDNAGAIRFYEAHGAERIGQGHAGGATELHYVIPTGS